MTEREALKLALDAWENGDGITLGEILKKALAQPEHEPVAWGNFKEDGTLVGLSQHPEDQANWMGRKPLYTHPPQRKPLTDGQIYSMVADITDVRSPYLQFAKAIEAAHGIKENT